METINVTQPINLKVVRFELDFSSLMPESPKKKNKPKNVLIPKNLVTWQKNRAIPPPPLDGNTITQVSDVLNTKPGSVQVNYSVSSLELYHEGGKVEINAIIHCFHYYLHVGRALDICTSGDSYKKEIIQLARLGRCFCQKFISINLCPKYNSYFSLSTSLVVP